VENISHDLVKHRKLNIIMDGQFGSTGKGSLAAWLGTISPVEIYVSNLSPNAGHTYDLQDGYGPRVVKQLPIGGIINKRSQIYLSHGSIIEPKALLKEIETFNVDKDRICIDPRAAIVTDECKALEKDNSSSVAKIASTQSGTGVALSQKIMRSAKLAEDIPELKDMIHEFDLMEHLQLGSTAVMETSQGFDLGLNYGLSYPHCTSRDVTPSQCLGDAKVHPKFLGNVFLTLRTYPIRVGNLKVGDITYGESGPFYLDSKELSWEELMVTPEKTTVTQRIRRVATFSPTQLKRTIYYTKPKHIFLNFINYILTEEYIEIIIDAFRQIKQFPSLLGFGRSILEISRARNLTESKDIMYAQLCK